jgi:hypothetical protein
MAEENKNELELDFSNAVVVSPSEEEKKPEVESTSTEGVSTESTSTETLDLDLSGAEKVEPPEVKDEDKKKTSKFQVLDQARDAGLEGWANYDLPEPDMTMYDDIERSGMLGQESFTLALKRYDMYKNHPNSERSIDGRVVYKGKVVPMPNASLFGDHSPGVGEMLYGGVRNMVGNVAELGGAGIDWAREKFQTNVGSMFWFNKDGEFDPDWKNPEELAAMSDEDFQAASLFGGRTPFTEMAQKSIADVKPGDSIGNTLLMEGTSMMVPGVFAVKMINYTGKGSKLLKFLAFEGAATAGTSSDAGGLFLGENAMFKGAQDVFPMLKGVQAEPGSPEFEKVLANRANILMEAMAIGKTLEKSVEGLTFGLRFMWSITGQPLSRIARPSAKEDALARQILDSLTAVGTDPKTNEEARRRIIELVRENKDVYMDMNPELAKEIRYTADTMTALEKALDAGDIPGAEQIIIKAQGIRKGVIQQGAPETTVKMAQPGKELERLTKQTEEALGGETGIVGSSDAIAASGKAEVDAAVGAVTNIEGQIAKIDEALAKVVTGGDAGIVSKVADLEKTVGFDITSGANKSADALRDNILKASKTMDDEKNRLFGLVKGGAVDIDGMISTLKSLQPGQLDIASSAFPGDAMLGKLLNEVKPKLVKPKGWTEGDSLVRETEEQVSERVKKWATKNNLSFETLFTDVRISLSDSIGRMLQGSASEKGAAQSLIKFKQWIDNDAIKFLEETGDDATVEAAQNALGYFKNTWAKYWDDGSVLTDVGRLRRETSARGIKEPMMKDASRNMITDTLDNRNREVVGNMVELLKRPEAGESATDVVDYIIGDTLSKIANRVDDVSKLPNLDISDVRQSLSGYASILRTNFPDEAKRLDDLIETLRTAKGDKATLEAQLATAQKVAAEAEERIYKRELDKFFSSQGIPNVNGYESFRKLFSDPNAIRIAEDGTASGPLVDVLTRVDSIGDPLVRDGVQAAYSRYVRENFLTATRESGGNRMVSLGALNKSENEISKILSVGDEVYKDKPLVMQAVRGLLGEAGLVQRSRNAKAVGASSGTAEANAAIAAVNRVVTMTLGVLSRTGARIRSGASGYIMGKIDPKYTAQVLDHLLADPDYFIKIATRVTDADGGVNPENAMLLRQWLIRSGIFSEDNEPSEEDFLLQLADAELSFTRAKNTVNQTVEAFGDAVLNK